MLLILQSWLLQYGGSKYFYRSRQANTIQCNTHKSFVTPLMENSDGFVQYMYEIQITPHYITIKIFVITTFTSDMHCV